ncbi:MAG: hypothetical protein HUU04_04530 [Verrucomicrobiae bacterium]|nr:hypothetical protein [Verrucomicrobiae bacterium]
MISLPPDWKDDAALWKALGRLPRAQPSSRFAAEIRARREEARQPSAGPLRRVLISLHDWITMPRSTPRWAVAAAAGVACLTLGFFLQTSVGPAASIRGEGEALARNFDLIQNLDVIEHLDQL